MRAAAIASFFLLFSLQSAPWAAGTETSSDCLKQVFGKYCLGGSMQQLLRRQPYGMLSQQSGERRAVIYPQGRERTYVMAYQGKIYKVLHTFEPASQSKLKELLERLESKYGAYRDSSHYPAYVRTQAARIGAIRRGEGELIYRWQSPDESWSVELSWTRRLGISLAYLANALDEKQQQALNSGF
ncbi:MAG: hypothetical protein P8045_12520 [Candidatus Thiodiazotropha sp.]